MIIVDTSVWIDHFRGKYPDLSHLIANEAVCLHPYVLGELLLGGLPADSEAAASLAELAHAPIGSAKETAAFIVWGNLSGTGVGYVDVHLLVSARLLHDGQVLTRDKRLHAQAMRFGLAYRA